VGGVDIEVPETFTDDKFPKSDVDVTKVKDEALLYETITFEKGLHHFDGITALKYIRSRHSQNQIEGNDQARNQRQQQLIQAIISKIKSKSVISNPNILGNLYKILRQELNLPLNDEQLIALIKANGLKFPSIKSFSLPIADDKEQGLIYHPSALIYGQWVFQPIDPTWNQIKNFVSQEL
jgi:anionic cell wall polymer biosynthesis LytR-Cps2A-Psr (LCP) family protein